VSNNYVAHYYPNGVPVPEPTQEEAPQTPTPRLVVDPEVAAIANQVVDSIDAVLTTFDNGEYDIVFDDLVALAEALECDACKEAIRTEAIHVSNVRNVCDHSQAACAEEQTRVRRRLVRLQQMYIEIRGSPEPTDAVPEPASSRPLPPYHARMSECLTSDKFDGLEKKLRFCGCSKLSSDKATTEDEAIELCTINTLEGVEDG